MADVFISYARVNADFVRKLHDGLAAAGRDAWVDWQDIPLTAEWLQEIYAGIDAADNFAFVITPESVRSATCQKEIAHAVESHKRLIPILHRATPDTDIPESLAKLNFVFFRDSDDFERAFKALIETLETNLDWKKAHTRLLVRAKEWERKGKSQSLLLRGDDLREAEKWQAQAGTKEPRPNPIQAQYILASRQAETRRQRLMVGLSAAALVITTLLAIVAILQRNTARQEAAIATARQLAAQAELARGTSPETSALLSIESSRLAAVPENSLGIHRTMPLLRKAVAILPHREAVEAVAFSPDMKLLATASEDRTARMFILPAGTPLLTYLHGDLVSEVAFSPDGHYFATASWDGNANVMSAADPKHPVKLPHRWRVDSVSFSPDGKYLATGSWDKSARVFEVGTWKQVAQVKHGDIVVNVAWDPSSRYVVSSGFDARANVFVAATGDVIHALQHNGAVHMAIFSPDGHYIAAASWDKTARVFEASTGEPVMRLDLPNRVESVAFSPDSKYLLAGGDDNTARVFEVPSGRELARVNHQLTVNAVAWAPDGRYAASGSADGTAAIFDPITGRLAGRVEHPIADGAISSIKFSKDGRYLATGGFDGTARISSVAEGSNNPERFEHRGKVLTVALSPGGQYLATGTWDGTVLVSGTNSGKQVASIRFDGAIYAIAFSRDGRYMAAAEDGIPSLVQVIDVNGGIPPLKLKQASTARTLNFSPGGHILAAVGPEDTLQLIPLPEGKPALNLLHDKVPNSLEEIFGTAFSPDGRYIATSRTDGVARIFETGNGRLTTRLPNQRTALELAFSPDGRHLLARTSDNTAHVFDARTGKLIVQLAHAGGILAVRYSRDGRYIATGGGDKAVHVFEAATGNPIAQIETVGPVKAVEFSADGKYVISASSENEGSEDSTFVVRRDAWNPSDISSQLCSLLNRNFTPTEWNRYFPGQRYRKTCANLP
jgi:WD40 repeat protein